MEWLFSLPASCKIGACFGAILLLYRLGVSFGWAILAGTVLLTFLTGTGTGGFLNVGRACARPEYIGMLIVVILLTFFSDALAHTGRMEKTIDAFRRVIRNPRALFAGLPAIMGLLPMPGGALFSAPFVASLDGKENVPAELKSAVNYWFRHIWEYWWPLYPGVILAMQYTHLPFGLFLLIQIPFTGASILGGYLFLLRRLSGSRSESAAVDASWAGAVRSLWPVGILVLISVAASFLLPVFGVSKSIANLSGMIAGLIIALAVVLRKKGLLFETGRRFFSGSSNWMLILAVAGALLFSVVLQMRITASGATLVSQMRDEIMGLGVPMLLVIIAIPFVSGIATGITVGFVGASFPIVFALVGPHAPMHVVLATTSLAYVSGYIGEMLSPVHLCYIMSNEYFKARMTGTYRLLAGPAAVVALAMALLCSCYFFIWR